MYCADTLRHVNDERELLLHLQDNPMAHIVRAQDVKRAPDYAQVDLSLLEKVSRRELVDTYFVDSSGFGSAGEPALQYSNFQEIVNKLLEEKGEDENLYAVLSGVGQFQVYVSIFREVF